MGVTTAKAKAAAQAVVDVVNNYNKEQLALFKSVPGVEQSMCARWFSGNVIWAAKYASNESKQ